MLQLLSDSCLLVQPHFLQVLFNQKVAHDVNNESAFTQDSMACQAIALIIMTFCNCVGVND